MRRTLTAVFIAVAAVSLLAGPGRAQTSPNITTSDLTTHYQWDAARRLTMQIGPDPDGSGPLRRRAEAYTYDPDGQLVELRVGSTSNTAGSDFQMLERTRFRYDAAGNRTHAYAHSGESAPARLTQMGYDANDRLLCTAVRMDPSQFEAIFSGALVVDACVAASPTSGDRITKHTYDAAGQLVRTVGGVGSPVEATLVAKEYTPNGQTAFVIDGVCNATKLVYDGFDRLKTQHFPVTTRGAACTGAGAGPGHPGAFSATDYESYDYDRSGNRTLLRKRDGTQFLFSYDALNRLRRKEVAAREATSNAAPRTVHYAYDLTGRMHWAMYDTPAVEGVVYEYDRAGRMTAEVSYGSRVEIERNNAGARRKLTWPDGSAVEYGYDAAGQVVRVAEPGWSSGLGVLASFQYDDLGRRRGVTRGNQAAAAYDYDGLSRLNSVGQTGKTGAGGLAGSLQTLTYTPSDQVRTVTQVSADYVWAGRPPLTDDTHDGQNRIHQFVSNASYDRNGNLTNNGIRAFAFDAENRLIRIGEGPTARTLTYDPTGRLRSIEGGGLASTFFLHVGDELIGEYGASGSGQPALHRYVHGEGVDDPLVWYDGAQRVWLHADRQGSIIGTSDKDGAVTSAYTYGPWGEPHDWAGVRFRYTGQAVLHEAQLYHYKARVYDPVLGRFLQTDPIGQADDPNLYAYVKGDPVNNADPTGMIIETGWDLFSAGLGWSDTISKARSGDGWGAVAAGAGAVVDTAAVFIPAVPGGVSAARRGVEAAVDGAKGALKPGRFAGESVPASGPGRITSGERAEVNRIGRESGCHTCGTKDPGTKSGNFVGDHQPPSSLAKSGEKQQLYPHCLSCSRQQGGQVRQAVEAQKPPPPPRRPPDEP